MAFISKKNSVVFVTEEVTEGTAVAPTLGVQAVGILSDGFAMDGEKELIDRNVLRSGISKQIPLTGIKSSTASIGVEASASLTEGSAPEFDLLMKSAFGGKHQVTTEVTSSGTGVNTTSKVFMVLLDAQKFMVGEMVVVKVAGDYHFSPIKAIVEAGAASYIELLIADSLVFADAVKVSKVTTYYGSNTGHSSLTITSFLDQAIKMQASGMKVSSVSLDGFEVGQLPSFNFSMNGVDYVEAVEAQTVTASFSSATPALVLGACVLIDGVAVAVQNVAWSLENTLGRITSTCAANGIIAQITSERMVSGSFTAYLENDSVAMYTKFNANTQFSLFMYMKNPSATAGQGKNWIGVYLPACVITGQPKGDADGIVTIDVSFQAGEDASGKDIFVSFV